MSEFATPDESGDDDIPTAGAAPDAEPAAADPIIQDRPPLSKDDQALRDQQLSFYSGDVDRLNNVLKSYLKKSKAKTALLITTGGHLITREGEFASLDTDTVAALVSGAFAATRKLFDVFGEKNFNLTVQKGEHESIYLGLVGGRSLLTVLFDDATNQGTIQLYATQATKKLEQIFSAIERGEGAGPGEDDELSDDFGDEASGALDGVFG